MQFWKITCLTNNIKSPFVICVDDSNMDWFPKNVRIKRNNIYTIKEVVLKETINDCVLEIYEKNIKEFTKGTYNGYNIMRFAPFPFSPN